MIPVSYLTDPLLTGGGGEQGLQAAALQGQGGDRRFRGECATAKTSAKTKLFAKPFYSVSQNPGFDS